MALCAQQAIVLQLLLSKNSIQNSLCGHFSINIKHSSTEKMKQTPSEVLGSFYM